MLSGLKFSYLVGICQLDGVAAELDGEEVDFLADNEDELGLTVR
jgi:hypothetical protein